MVITANSSSAAPLGVPTLLAFMKPHVCCCRVASCRRQRSPAVAPASAATGVPEVGAAGNRAAVGSGHVSSVEGSLRPDDVDGSGRNSGAAVEDDRVVKKTDMEAAAAAGAAVAGECGSTGDQLVSRVALEALGLLVEGLATHQVGLMPSTP